MKIHRLYIQNFRGIEEIDLNMDGRTAVIFGINGTGKTTILDVCDILFYRLLGFSKIFSGTVYRERSFGTR